MLADKVFPEYEKIVMNDSKLYFVILTTETNPPDV